MDALNSLGLIFGLVFLAGIALYTGTYIRFGPEEASHFLDFLGSGNGDTPQKRHTRNQFSAVSTPVLTPNPTPSEGAAATSDKVPSRAPARSSEIPACDPTPKPLAPAPAHWTTKIFARPVAAGPARIVASTTYQMGERVVLCFGWTTTPVAGPLSVRTVNTLTAYAIIRDWWQDGWKDPKLTRGNDKQVPRTMVRKINEWAQDSGMNDKAAETLVRDLARLKVITSRTVAGKSVWKVLGPVQANAIFTSNLGAGVIRIGQTEA